MRRALMILPLLFACAKTDAPPADAPPAMAATPVALTEADVAGTWTGEALVGPADSVFGKFTEICAAGTCKGILDGSKDTVTSTYMLMADSVMGVSNEYMDKTLKAKVTDHYFLHIKDGQVTGTGAVHLASKPDSVLMTYKIRGSRKM